MKKFQLIIEDDFELMGNGLGNVASHQYLPTLFLMKLAKSLGLQLSFMVDVAQQLVFDEMADSNRKLKTQKLLWDDTVCQIKEEGFDVQLHLHAQWLGYEYKDGFFHLDKNWSIARVKDPDRKSLIKDSIDYLNTLLKPLDADYRVKVFKAGSWALQPSKGLFSDFEDLGINLVLGARKDMNVKGLGVNYENMEEETLPYYPDHNDLTQISKKGNITMLPLTYVYPSWKDFLGLGRTAFLESRIKRKIESPYLKGLVPEEIKKNSPTGEKIRFRVKASPYLTHLKIGGPRSFSYLKNTFDKSVKRLRKIEGNGIPIVIESHTKNFINNYKPIEQFLTYVVEKYGHEMDFISLSEYSRQIEKGEVLIKERK